MAFDLAILDNQGKPSRQVSIGVAEHFQLLALAKDQQLPLIQRMSDYYADVEFSSCELKGFSHELQIVQGCMTSEGKPSPAWILDVMKLVCEAMDLSIGIVGIAD